MAEESGAYITSFWGRKKRSERVAGFRGCGATAGSILGEEKALGGVNGLFNFSLLTGPWRPSGQISSSRLRRAQTGPEECSVLIDSAQTEAQSLISQSDGLGRTREAGRREPSIMHAALLPEPFASVTVPRDERKTFLFFPFIYLILGFFFHFNCPV